MTEVLSSIHLGTSPACADCKVAESFQWHRNIPRGVVLCNNCYHRRPEDRVDTPAEGEGSEGSSNGAKPPAALPADDKDETLSLGVALRKPSRLKAAKFKSAAVKTPAVKTGKSRHAMMKKNPLKAPTSVSTIVTRDWVLHKGTYFQVGDVVSLMDHDGGLYYGALRGLLEDQYCQKSGVITWLIPSQDTPSDAPFHPAAFVLGPEEDVPRKLDYMEFVCHAPSDYFKASKAPYPTEPQQPELGFVWTSIGPDIKKKPTLDQIFGTGHARAAGAGERHVVDTEAERRDKVKKKKKEHKEGKAKEKGPTDVTDKKKSKS